MTDVKAQELSYDEWHELLEPYGYADITMRTAVTPRGYSLGILDYDIRVMLKPSPPGSGLGEWAERSYLLDQARQAAEAVRAKGYVFEDAPQIEFGGRYMYHVDRGSVPDWVAEASLRFRVVVP